MSFVYKLPDGDKLGIEKIFGSFEVAIIDSEINHSELIIPDNIDGIPVSIIGWRAFANNKDIKRVIIPATVTQIRAEAFQGCSRLSEIVFQNSDLSIERKAFSRCNKELNFVCSRLSPAASYAKANNFSCFKSSFMDTFLSEQEKISIKGGDLDDSDIHSAER